MVNVEDIISIVRSSADMMKSGYADVSMKDGYANIVTSSDIAVQEYLCERLGKLLPGSGFLCEESDINDDGHEYTWIVDPIDGTCNYSRGIPQCAICVGLCHNDDPDSVELIDNAIAQVSGARSSMGAVRNRLEHAYNNNANTEENIISM